MSIDFLTALLSAIGLGATAAVVYLSLDMVFKRGCFSMPCGLKYGTMFGKLVAFSATYTLGVGAASFGTTQVVPVLNDAGGYSFRYGLGVALISCITIVIRRSLYEQANWSYFTRLPRPGGEETEDKSVPPLFGMSLPLSFNKLLDEFEERAMMRVREQLEDRGYSEAVKLVEVLGGKAPELLVRDFMHTHIFGNGRYSDEQVNEISEKLEARTQEAGYDSLERTRYIMGDIRHLGYHDFVRKRKLRQIARRYRSSDSAPA